MSAQNILVFASGTRSGGGSGFRNLAQAWRNGQLGSGEIVGVVCNNMNGGVRTAARDAGVPMFHHPGPMTAEDYRALMDICEADWAVLSGWNRRVSGLRPNRTLNVHPGPLPGFGGQGMYGLKLHAAVLDAFARGEVTHTEVCMHFVTEEYDDGPVIFRHPVPLLPGETAENLQERVKGVEHLFQPYVTKLVVSGEISWSGIAAELPAFPAGYSYM